VVTANVPGQTVFNFKDPTIVESSNLIDLGSVMLTTNDSGGAPVVYVVDSRTGQTVATTTYARSVEDTEALAPDGPDHVWVGDIGDNNVDRPSVAVYRVPISDHDQVVDAPAYTLVYPDGPHDAESLLYGPDGRLRIITKSILGGRVYIAPKVLERYRQNQLTAGPPVDLYATDAALMRDHRHVLVRGYGGALLATFPGFKTLAEFGLPSEQQGEGISVGPTGRIRLSSEGVHSPVLQIKLPAEVRAALRGELPKPLKARPDVADPPAADWRWVGWAALATAILGALALRKRRLSRP
jgi:hypothetical protein